MKTILKVIFTSVLIFFSNPSIAFAEENHSFVNLTTVSELHEHFIQLNLLSINENGQINLDYSDIYSDIDEELLNKYIDSVDSTNRLINEGYGKLDSNLTFTMASLEEIQEISRNSSPVMKQSLVTPFNIPEANLISLVESNRRSLEKWYWDAVNAYSLAGLPNPTQSAWTSSVGWWLGKVNHGGPWDYKSTSMGPYNRQWYCYTYSGYRTLTTEYIGNYNYGYTGQFLFSLSILLAGGQYASGNLWVPEDAADRNAITAGYNDSVGYW